MRSSRGADGLRRVRAAIQRNPGRWNDAFDDEVQRSLWTHVTGAPWSLYDYTLRRLQFHRHQEDLERLCHILSGLHACHRMGPSHHDELGAKIRQAYKAAEQAARDNGDWTLAWTWLDCPNPRPHRYERGLVHPAEYSAGISYLRELQTLEGYHAGLRTGQGDNGGRKGGKGSKGKGEDYGELGAARDGGKGDKSSKAGRSGKRGKGSQGADAPQGQ